MREPTALGSEQMKRNILFISGSLGLGHVTRDIAIANEIRALRSDIQIQWLAAHPASDFLKENGETVLPEASDYLDENLIAESTANGFRLSLFEYALAFRRQWHHNINLVDRLTARGHFDLLIGDETYDLVTAFKKRPELKRSPFVMIYDFVGFDAMTRNPLERLGIHIMNRMWASGFPDSPPVYDLGLFVGQPDDVPDRSFGLMLPNRRKFAEARYRFVGYILPFKPDDYADTAVVRAKLGYGQEKLIVCAVGGTSIGRELLELCGKSYHFVKERIPDARMVLITGPRIAGTSIDIPAGVEVREYVPSLYRHFAACDIAVVQAGGTTTLELTALKKPFLYFPIEGHCEQERYVAARLARHRAGVRMKLSNTSPQVLAEKIVSGLGQEVNYTTIATDGARAAAKCVAQLIGP